MKKYFSESDKKYGLSADQNDHLISHETTFDWKPIRPSFMCGCFRFVVQLVLVGCCGSFLFGFNIALLNTAVNVVYSDFQVCGVPSGFSSHLYDVLRTGTIEKAKLLCDNNTKECSECSALTDKNGVLTGYRCPGGYTDLSCSSFKWYVALIQTAIMIGGVFGALTAGRLMRHGRRRLFLIMALVFGIGVISSVCSNSFSSLMWSRLIVGFGVGLSSVISPTYISEMTSRRERGKFGVFHQLAITVGIFFGIILGLPLVDPNEQLAQWIPDPFTQFWWRFMVGIGLVPVILSFYLLGYVYSFETPVYYAEQNSYHDAYEALDRILEHKDIQQELDDCIENVKAGVECKSKGVSLSSAMRDPKYRLAILVGIGLAGFQQFGGINVFMTSSTGLFQKAGLKKNMQQAMTIIMALINCVMTFPTVLLIEKLGRRTILLYGSALQFLCVVPCAISYWTEINRDDPTAITQGLAIFGVMGFVLFFAVGFGPIVWVYLFEIYPMEIKDAASSAATAFNWVAAIIIVFVANVLHNQVSFTLFALLQLLATLFIFFFMKETKGLPLGTSPYVHNISKVIV